MSIQFAQAIVTAAAVYAALGVLFALVFVCVGAPKLDPAARAGTKGFRILIFPGAAALWPILLSRWVSGGEPVERNAHRDGASGEEQP